MEPKCDDERMILKGKEPLTITPAFEKTFQKLLSLEKSLKPHSLLSSILAFPLGLITLPGIIPLPLFPCFLSLNLLLLVLFFAAFVAMLTAGLMSPCGPLREGEIDPDFPPYCYVVRGTELYSLIFLGFSLHFLVGVILAGVGNHLERKLLKEDPNSFLFLRQNCPATPTLLSPFDITCRKASVLQRQLRGFVISFCIFWFPVGLLFLIGFQKKIGINVLRMKILSGIAFLLHIVWFIMFGILLHPGFLAIPAAFLILLITFTALLLEYEKLQGQALQENEEKFYEWNLSNQDPVFNAWRF